jgi:hypothetical protein
LPPQSEKRYTLKLSVNIKPWYSIVLHNTVHCGRQGRDDSSSRRHAKTMVEIDQASMYVTQFHLAITNKDLLSKTNKESIETIEK